MARVMAGQSLAGDELLQSRQRFGWSRDGAVDDLCELPSARRVDFEAAFLRIGEEVRIGDHLVEGLAQHGDAFGRNVRRRDDAPPDAGVRILEFEDAAAFLAGRQRGDERDVLELGMGLDAGLEWNDDEAVAQPLGALGLEQGPGRHPAVHLPALDREIDVWPADPATTSTRRRSSAAFTPVRLATNITPA